MRQLPHAARRQLAQTFSPKTDQSTRRNESMNTRNRYQNSLVAALVVLVSVTAGLFMNIAMNVHAYV
jgi:hypothetical protein